MPDQSSSYNFDQAQYLLLLMLIISIAEKRTQDLYVQNFAQRCDAIGKEHDLGDDEYWQNEAVPAEWSELNREFEEASRRILVETLSEYHQQEIAKLIETEGAEDFFEIIRNIRVQFSRVFTNSDPDNTHPPTDQSGSFPETLLSFRKMVSTTS